MKNTLIVMRLLVFIAVLSCGVASGGGHNAKQGLESEKRRTPEVLAVEGIIPSVVNISTERLVRVSDPFNDYFRDFFEEPGRRFYRESVSLGSGVLIASPCLVLTNFHVVRRATNINVRFMDGSVADARIAAYNQENDLALLELTKDEGAPEIPPIPLAWPDDLMLAETVLAVGNPFGLENSVASGVLSAINRHWRQGDFEFDDILQTDAAINPGNSGGPLVNLDGEMIGINLAIRAGAEGIGFAIPIKRIEEVLASWLVPEYFANGTCGFIPMNRIGEDGVLQVVVEQVDSDGPAAAAGIRDGDVITEIDGELVNRSIEVSRRLWQLRPGDTVDLTLEGQRTVGINIKEMKPDQLIARRLGLRLQKLTPSLRKALGVPDYLTGLVISDILADGPTSKYDLRRGDILYGVENNSIADIEELSGIIRESGSGQSLNFNFFLVRGVHNRMILSRRTIDIILQ